MSPRKKKEPGIAAREELIWRAGVRQQGVEELMLRNEQLRKTVLRADEVGIPRSEIARLSGLAPATVYAWLSLAGRPMSNEHGGKR